MSKTLCGTTKKKVNIINSPVDVYIFTPPQRGTFMGIKLYIGEIRRVIDQGVAIEEVFEDGSTLKLTYANYDKDNTPVKKEEITEGTNVVENANKQTEATNVVENADKQTEDKVEEVNAKTEATNVVENADKQTEDKVEEVNAKTEEGVVVKNKADQNPKNKRNK